MPCSARSLRFEPSNWNGFVTTATVSAPMSFAISAMIGAAPVSVPPPIPAVTNTMSASFRASYSFSLSSSADFRPTEGSAPAPRPLVILSPMRILCGASDMRSACASVFTAMNSTPMSSARIIRFTAFDPPPPTPTTFMSAKFSMSLRRGMGEPPRSFHAVAPPLTAATWSFQLLPGTLLLKR